MPNATLMAAAKNNLRALLGFFMDFQVCQDYQMT